MFIQVLLADIFSLLLHHWSSLYISLLLEPSFGDEERGRDVEIVKTDE